MSRPLSVALVLAALAAGLPGQQAPTFLGRTDVVLLDVSVVDRDKQPIRGLTAAAFTVQENGKPQKIEYFKEIELPNPAVAPTAWMRDVAPDVVRNEEVAERRLMVIVMDDSMMPFDLQMVSSAKQIARDTVNRLGPGDLAAVVFTRDNRRAQDFTRDRARLFAAIDSFTSSGYSPMGTGDNNGPCDNTKIQYCIDSILTLRSAAELLGGVPERRKILLYVGLGIPITFDDRAKDMAQLAWLAEDALRKAQRGGVNFFAVDPSGLDGLRLYLISLVRRPGQFLIDAEERKTTLFRDFLLTVTERTGGHAFINYNDFASQVDQLFLETGFFYLLGYMPPDFKPDGRFRRLQLRVARPGATVRVRTGYYAPPPPNIRGSIPASPALQALTGLVPKTDLPMQVTTAPFAVAGREEAAVVVTLGLRAPSGLSGTDSVDVLMSAFTTMGDPRTSQRFRARVDLASGGDYEVLGRIDLKPGRYELRLSGDSQSLARSGSVYTYVDTPDFSRDRLSMSGMTMSTIPPAVTGNAAALADLLPVVPTSRRVFATSDRATAFLRLYQGGRDAIAPVAVTTRLVDARDQSVVNTTDTFGPDRFRASRSADVSIDLPLAKLAAGEYVLMVDAASGSSNASRAVRFSVR